MWIWILLLSRLSHHQAFILHKVPESLNHSGERGHKLPILNTSLHIDRHPKAYCAAGKVVLNCANPQWRWKYLFKDITVKMVVRLGRIKTYHSGKTHCRAAGMRKYPFLMVSTTAKAKRDPPVTASPCIGDSSTDWPRCATHFFSPAKLSVQLPSTPLL